MKDDIDIHYFGWSPLEIDAFHKNYQSKFLGGERDARFFCINNEGMEYYAIFRGYLGEEGEIAPAKIDWLLFKDNNRVLLNVCGKLYRFVISAMQCLPIDPFEEFFKSITYPQSYVPSISSNEQELMIFCETKIVAISWDDIVWEHSIEQADYCDVEILSLDSEYVYIHHHNGWGTDEIIKLSIRNGMPV